MPFRLSTRAGKRLFNVASKNARPRRAAVQRATGQAIEMLEGRVLLAVVSSLVDPLTGPGVDTTKWTVTTRGLESSVEAGYNAPTEDANGLVLGGTTTHSYWAGDSLESVDDFSSQTTTTISVDRVSLTGLAGTVPGSAWRSSLWILQPNGDYLHFAQNSGENGWQYNAKFTNSTIATAGGVTITQFNNTANTGEHVMKLVYTPGPGSTADVGIYLDGLLGPTVHFTDWDHTVPFKAILTGQARGQGDSVTATFKSFDAEADVVPTNPPLAPTNLTATAPAHGLAVNLSWLDNANNETNYHVERSTDGTNFTEIATIPAVLNSGTTATYTDVAPAANTKFYYRVRAFNTANNGSFTDYATATPITTPPAILSLVDPLTGNGIDTTKWNITNRGLEHTGDAGFTATEDPSGLYLAGTATNRYWYGASLESKDVFNSQATTTITVDRNSLTSSSANPTGYRSSLWILQPTANGQFLHFGQDIKELGWSFNQTINGEGTNIPAFDSMDNDGGNHVMKLVYTPLGGSNATVDMYIDDVLGATATFTNWDNTVPFEVILTGQARDIGDNVSAQFTNFSATAVLPPPALAPTNLTAQKVGTGINLAWTDNSDSELFYSVERSSDGTNFSTIATLPASQGAGGTVLYTDNTAATGTYFYRVRAFNYANLGSYSAPSNIAVASLPAPITTPIVDPLTEDAIDPNIWTITQRGLENTGPAGYSDPVITPSGVLFGGTATNQYWFGSSLETTNTFSSSAPTTVQAERVFLGGSTLTGVANGPAYRSSLWILQPGGQFLHFAQDAGETTGWEYNQTIGGSGIAIPSFNTAAPDPGTDHVMKLVYTPLGGTNATVDIYLDDVLGATATFNNWDNSVPFRVIIGGMARKITDNVSVFFDNVSITPTPPTPTVISGSENADTFYIKKNADGINDDLWINSPTPGVGAPTQQVLLAQAAGLEFDGLGGNDRLTVDYSAGSPIPGTGLKFAGGDGTDTLKIIGAGATDAFGLGSAGVNHAGGGMLMPQSDVESLALSQGNYAVDVQAVVGGNISSLDVGIGGTVRVIYPDAPPGDPNTALLVSTIKSLLASGRNGGAWNGPGISSADAGTHHNTALGYSNANDVFTIKFTLAGDTNLDGVVSFADLVAIAQHYGKNDSSIDWAHGDVTYDGQVSFADLVAVAQTYGQTAPTAASTPAAIPASAPVAAEASVPAAVVANPPVVTVSTPPKVTISTPPVKPVVKPVVTSKPPVATTSNTATSLTATGKPSKPAPVTTPFAAKTSLTSQSRLEVGNADVLGKKSNSAASLFL